MTKWVSIEAVGMTKIGGADIPVGMTKWNWTSAPETLVSLKVKSSIGIPDYNNPV